MIEQGLHRYSVVDKVSGEKLDILRPVPTPDTPWGVLECIRDTEVGGLIPTVSGEAMSHALHGYMLPLRRTIGREPKYILRKIKSDMTCGLIDTCILARRDICKPHVNMPHCYMPPDLKGLQAHAVSTVLRAWADGRYVVIVQGDEFSL